MIRCLVLVLSLLAAPALAQRAPEGNAHPQTQAVSKEAGELPNPFGQPSAEIATADAKIALAKALDLEPLRTLAVQHDGRVKILDTLARETVSRICGRKTYQDFIPVEGHKVRKVSYDPL